MSVYTVTAANCPALNVPTTLIDPADGLPTTGSTLTAGASGSGSLTTPFNRNAARIDALGQVGAGAYAIKQGTGLLTAGSGLTLNVSEALASIDGPVHLDATTLALTDEAYNWIWLLQGGTVTKTTDASTTPPAAPSATAVFLGRVYCTAGAISVIDYSGRLEWKGGTLYRRTADTGAPADTPSASLVFLAETAGGYYLWTGSAYREVVSLTKANTWTQKQTFGGEIEVDGALNHDGTTVGFRGATPVVMPTAYTQTYATAARTLPAYTSDPESVAYTGIDNAQAGTVYAPVADLNALRVAYETLRAHSEATAQVVNSLIDDLQAVGLIQ